MEAKVSPLVTGGQGSPASTPQDMTYSNNLLHTAALVPNQLGTSAPATNLPVSQPHPSVTSGMTAGVQPAAVSRVVQPAMTLANIMPAPGQPHRTGPVAPGQLHRPGPVAPGQLHRPGPGASGQPQRPAGPGVAGRARTGAVAPQLAVRPQQATYLNPGSAIPTHGMTLMRTEMGQMVMVPQHFLAQMQAKHLQGQTVPTIHPRPATPTPRQFPAIRMGAPILPMPGMALGKNPISVTAQANQKLSDPGGGTFRDDDINDVASMAGVNLNEENARILATSSELVGTKIRSCKDENFLATGLLQRRILHIARRFGVSEVPVEVVNFISHATQCRLSALLEKVSAAARHRTDGCGGMDAEGGLYEQSSDVRAQLRFFKQLESMEKQRKDEQEREILLKAARSRARQEDPEQACLKQKAKEIQQQELALIQQHDANRTALDAIGPRKKRKLDSPPEASGADSEAASGVRGACLSAAVTASQKPRKQVTRVNLWDFIFCVEQERPRSLLLYKALLR